MHRTVAKLDNLWHASWHDVDGHGKRAIFVTKSGATRWLRRMINRFGGDGNVVPIGPRS